MSAKPTLPEIRKAIEGSVGKKIILKTNTGKRNANTREGVVEFVYPSLFTVRIIDGFDSNRRVSYTYSDVLTESVEITFDAMLVNQEIS